MQYSTGGITSDLYKIITLCLEQQTFQQVGLGDNNSKQVKVIKHFFQHEPCRSAPECLTPSAKTGFEVRER